MPVKKTGGAITGATVLSYYRSESLLRGDIPLCRALSYTKTTVLFAANKKAYSSSSTHIPYKQK